jgi:tight adherence protein C
VSPSDLLLGGGIGAVFLALLLGGAGLLSLRSERTRVERSRALVQRFGRTSGGSHATVAVAPFRTRVLGPARSAAARLARTLSGKGAAAGLARRLDLAGNPPRWTVERIFASKGVGILGPGVLGAMAVGPSPPLMIAIGGACAAAGFFLPDMLLHNAALRRQERIQKDLADTVDLLVISIQAGLGFDAAVSQVVRNTTGPLAGEFQRVLQEMQIGKSRREAFQALSDRVGAQDVRHFVGAVVQADALGVPISGVLMSRRVRCAPGGGSGRRSRRRRCRSRSSFR